MTTTEDRLNKLTKASLVRMIMRLGCCGFSTVDHEIKCAEDAERKDKADELFSKVMKLSEESRLLRKDGDWEGYRRTQAESDKAFNAYLDAEKARKRPDRPPSFPRAAVLRGEYGNEL